MELTKLRACARVGRGGAVDHLQEAADFLLFRRILFPTAFVVSLSVAMPATIAQTPASPSTEAAWRAELDTINAEIRVTAERQREIEDEIAAVDRDRAELNATLIDTNRHVQELETQTGEAEQRMAGLMAEEGRLRNSLVERRGVLAQVLAVLQRMGRTPPPAIVVQPGDALAAVRSAILLGAVVPELRGEAEALAADLDGLVALRAEQEAERDRLRASALALAEESQRLEFLVAERQRILAEANDTLAAEAARAAGLAAQAGTLEELIAALNNRPEPAAAPEAAGQGPMAMFPPEAGFPVPINDADRIDAAIPFRSARGRLPRPVSGTLVASYGADDGFGGRNEGISVRTRAGARISSPADGWVEFAGSYRSYGNLLIINVGDGYFITISGMERIDVQLGQFVLAGEPIAAMPLATVAAAGQAALGTTDPVLYLEFRRDGQSIDPGPWWADPY